MPTSTQLATGLAGAIGCDFLQSRNRLYFVEYGGKVSRLDLVAPIGTVVFNGVATMPADSSLNLMNLEDASTTSPTGSSSPGRGGSGPTWTTRCSPTGTA